MSACWGVVTKPAAGARQRMVGWNPRDIMRLRVSECGCESASEPFTAWQPDAARMTEPTTGYRRSAVERSGEGEDGVGDVTFDIGYRDAAHGGNGTIVQTLDAVELEYLPSGIR